jgi:hypothetical protein
MVITTESGTVYDLTNGYCVRNGRFEFRYWWAYCFESVEAITVADLPEPFAEVDANRRLPLQAGKRMYLGGKDGWRVSTKIISIEGGD